MRTLDLGLGVPLILLLGVVRRKGKSPSNPKRIAFLRTAGLGDTVLMAGCTRAVKEAWPDAELVVFAGSNAPLAALLPGVDRVVTVHARRPLGALLAIRREGAFDVVVDFGQWPRTDALLSALSRSSFRVGFRTPGQWRHFAYDEAVEHRRDRHESENFAALLHPLGVSVPFRPELPRPDCAVMGDRVLIHMFSGGSQGRRKEWPEEHWIQVIRDLLEGGYRVVLTGSRVEAPFAEAVAACFGDRVRSLAGQVDLPELVREIARSALTISVDTGVAHIASALDVPLVGLYGPTSPQRWGPLGQKGIAVEGPGECLKCIDLGFERACPRDDCMRAIRPETVLEAAHRLLAAEKGRS